MNLLEEDSAHGPTRQAASVMPFHLRRIMKGVRQMKKIRKLMSALLAMSLVFSLLAVSASAAAASDAPIAGMTVEELAYMDTATASPTLKEAILDARRQIVYGDQAWTVDGAVSKLNDDGTVEPLPEFSDLWPEWNLDEICKRDPDPIQIGVSEGTFPIYYSNSVKLYPQSNTVKAPNFYEFIANGKMVYAWAYGIDRADKCNIGFENLNTGDQKGYWPGQAVNTPAILNTEWGVRYGVRASSVTSAIVNARMMVSETYKPLA